MLVPCNDVFVQVMEQSALRRRFGAVGEELAKVLSMFSLDIVSICADYAREPRFRRYIGSKGKAAGQFSYLNYLAWSPENELFVCDDKGVFVFNGDGKLLREWRFDMPRAIAFTDHSVLVSRYRSHNVSAYCLHALDLKSPLAETQGQSLSTLGMCWHNDCLFVVESARIVVFNADLTCRRVLTPFWGTSRYRDYYDCAVSADNELFVSDQSACRIMVLSLDGVFLRQFGSKGDGPGQLDFPRGLAFDLRGDLFVCDYNNNRIQAFTAGGQWLCEFGRGHVLNPSAICCGADGRMSVTSTPARVAVFDV